MATEIFLAAGFCGLALFFSVKRPARGKARLFALWAGLLLLCGLTVRLLVGFYARGFDSDIFNFKSWGFAICRTPLKSLYHEDTFLDYPPGYLYVLLILEKLRTALDVPFDGELYTLMIKLPSILTDLFCAGVLLWIGKRKLGERAALLLCAAYLFCPVVLINSARWGQVDSFCTAILLCSALLLYREWYVPSALLYGLSIACKPQMLIFAPMYLFFAVKRKKWAMLPVGVLCGLGAVLLTAAPFTEGFDFLWLLERYRSTLDYYNYYSINAYNFWAVIGWNWKTLPDGAAKALLTVAAPIAATAGCGWLLLRSKRKDAVFACPAVLMTVMYLFGIKMHERYLFPVFLFLLLCYLFTPDKRLLRAFAVTGTAHYLNVAHVLYLFTDRGGSYGPNEPVMRALACVQTAALLYGLYAVCRAYTAAEIREAPVWELLKFRGEADFPGREQSGLVRLDVLLMAVITLGYGFVAFWHLGARSTAVTPWTPKEGESVVLRAEEECDSVYYLPGIAPDGDHRAARTGVNLKVESSRDGKNWVGCGELQEGGTYVFAWAKFSLSTPGAYVRLTALDGGAVLNEAALKFKGRTTFAKLNASKGGEALIDEQSTVPYFFTYENSTYFDEIYHARTAYEHLLGLEPYENTHPPLGKYLIAAGIALFGMNPFGWRFMGTLFGVLMLPVLYHLLKQLFGKTSLCCVGTLLFAFDFMHFTQTRIATIDTYAVFFLLLMYDAMAAFLRRDLLQSGWRQLLVPLFCSGLFMGLGIASKWTAAYGALGLAALFFGKLYISLRAHWGREEERAELLRRAGILCGWCCLFFLVIPFALYFTAFLPMTTLPHNRANVWGNFWNYQVNMFNYHSQLKGEHYFASPWYEWPIDLRPIWYFSGSIVDTAGRASSISAFGNPLLWWSGIPALIAAAVLWRRERRGFAAVALCGFLSVYLPWVLVPRLTFIYHYFTAVPWLVVALCGVFSKLPETALGAKRFRLGEISVSLSTVFIAVFTAGCLILFYLFFPVISGAPVSERYLDALELFPTWYFH